MENNIDDLLKIALYPTKAPDERLNNQVLTKIKERKSMANKRKIPAAAVIAACTLLFGSVTALAAYHYLSPAQIAAEMEDDTLKDAFLGEDAVLVNETQESGGYRVTLLGSVAGKNISDYLSIDDEGIPKDDRIYTIVAIERADGTPMPDTASDEYGKEAFYVSHYIHGLNPNQYSLMSMGGGYSAFVKDGVEYRILEMDNIEMFADRGIYVGVSSGTFYDAEAYIYNENTGDMTRNAGYNGINALFDLPVDANKANSEAAKAYLEELQASWETPGKPIDMSETDLKVDEFMKKLTPENLDEYATPIESTRMVCTPDKDGTIYYEYELENGAAGSNMPSVTDLFPDDATAGSRCIGNCTYSGKGLESLLIDVFELNDDGTVTFVIYQPIV